MKMIIKDYNKRTYEEIKKDKCKEFRIFKPIKSLDVEIRTIKEEINDDRKEVYFIVKVGYYESLGELGLINSFFYDDIPTEEEVLKDVKEDLRNDLKEYEEKILTGREENYLKILRELKGGLK